MTADQKPGESVRDRPCRACAHCGSEATFPYLTDTGVAWYVNCNHCGARSAAHQHQWQAIAAWNRRAERNAGDAACKHDDGAMMWNPYNAVVQCHQCGTVDWPATHIHWLILLKNIREWGVSSRGYDAQKAVRFAKDIDQIIAPTTAARREGSNGWR